MFKTISPTGKEYTVVACKTEDIDTHYAMIADQVPQDEHKEHKQRMRQCIAEGTAFVLEDGSCFLYYLKTGRAHAEGVAMQGTGVPLKMLALFIGIFNFKDKDINFVRFALHKGKFINEYKSMITAASIKRNRANGTPLMVRVDAMREKCNRLTNMRTVE